MAGVTLTAGLQIAPYRLERYLGTGSCGEVWQASQDGLAGSKQPGTAQQVVAQSVAIKFINANLLTDSAVEQHLTRLRNEIATLKQLQDHPYIPAIYDHDLTFERPYLVMQYIDKPALSQLVSSGEILCIQLQQRLVLLTKIAQTVRTLHTNGFLHRDIKPANIHGITHPYLLDFSVALDRRQSAQVKGRVGTRLYMPPANGTSDDDAPPDERDDTYSLALVAYEVLFGQHPALIAARETVPPAELCALVEATMHTGQWSRPSQLSEQNALPRALTGAALDQLDATFARAWGPRAARYTDPTALIRDLVRAILIPANEHYLTYVPDVATTLSLQFSTEDDFTEDQVASAAHQTDHGHFQPVPRSQRNEEQEENIFSRLWDVFL